MEVTMDHTTTAAPVTCASCGAALADDQRYCLHCGQPQGDPRVAYRQLIAAAPEPQAAVTTAPAAAVASPPRDWTPVIALGGLAALALVLVVGVLIGKSGTPTAAAPVAPQVITVSGAAPAAATPTDAADTSGGGKAKHHAKGGGGKVSSAEAAAGARAVQDLNSASGEDYQRKSARLPDTVALPGRPPAADNKAPGGGSGAETIG
jgi:DNA-directed RNA polymerase subunit N (RpoN/RPB10)